MNRAQPQSNPDSHLGFPLRRVTWGYREQFRRLLDSLHDKGLLDEGERTARRLCGPFLHGEMGAGWDYVLREMLTALDGPAGWLLRVPELMRRWRALGVELTRERIHLGKRYFELWAEGGLLREPAHAERLLGWADELRGVEPELAVSLLAGYPELSRRLAPDRVPRFIESALRVHARSPDSANEFLRLRLKSARITADRLSRSCALQDVRGRLGRLFRAIAGRAVELDVLSRLDSDELIERGSGTVCAGGHLYLPERVSTFESRELNRAFYLLATVLSATCHREGSFPADHGGEDATSITEICRAAGMPQPALGAFLVQVAELRRMRERLEGRHPGCARMLREVAAAEMSVRGVESSGASVLAWAAGAADLGGQAGPERGLCDLLAEVASEAADYREAVAALAREWNRLPPAVRAAGPGFRARPLSSFPDFSFPIIPSTAPAEALVADLGAEGVRDEDGAAAAAERRRGQTAEAEQGPEEPQELPEGLVEAVYLYDEWNGPEGDYYRDWCRLHEVTPRSHKAPGWRDEAFTRRAERVRRLFQRLSPDLVSREKYLPHGDYIDIDSLVRFLTLRRAQASPRVRFWVKPRLSRRDVAVALLLDVSGSTGRESGRGDVIEVEKAAASVLATGLQELGDRFGVFGFTGNGRERCVFQVFKEFGQEWGEEAEELLAAARPGSSTRIGVALRHCGRKLEKVPAKTRLILLLTDARPMDTEYDPNTGYAQQDVRKACEENRALGIHTFCVAVEPDEPGDLDTMFPQRRYVVLREAEDLPDALARSYLRLTRQ